MLEALEGAIKAYRRRASRDAQWVATWTGQADPELSQIQALIEALKRLELTAAQRLELLEGLESGPEGEEPLLRQAIVEALLEQPKDPAIQARIIAHLTERAQRLEAPLDELEQERLEALSQLWFALSEKVEDFGLSLVLLGPARFLRACARWTLLLAAERRLTPFERHPGEALELVRRLEGALNAEERGATEIAALATLYASIPSRFSAERLGELLEERLEQLDAERLQDDAASREILAALGRSGAALSERALKALLGLLGTSSYGDLSASALAHHPDQTVSELNALLARTRHDPEALSTRIHAARALRKMPEREEVTSALLALCEDPCAPVRHATLYELIARDHAPLLSSLTASLLRERDRSGGRGAALHAGELAPRRDRRVPRRSRPVSTQRRARSDHP